MAFEIVSVVEVTQNSVSAGPEGLLEQLRSECRSREDLFAALYDYAARNAYLGDPSLSVDFIDTDGGSYSVRVSFQANWSLRREDADENYIEAYLEDRTPGNSELLDWGFGEQQETDD